MQDSSMNALFSTTHLSGANAAYLEELYERYLRDPNSIPSQWRAYFDALPRPQGYGAQDVPHSDIREYFSVHVCLHRCRRCTVNYFLVARRILR